MAFGISAFSEAPFASLAGINPDANVDVTGIALTANTGTAVAFSDGEFPVVGQSLTGNLGGPVAFTDGEAPATGQAKTIFLGSPIAFTDVNIDVSGFDLTFNQNSVTAFTDVDVDVTGFELGLNSKTYTVTVVYDGGVGANVFALDGVNRPAIEMIRGSRYIFDVSDSSVDGHPLRFEDSTGNSWTDGVTVTGTAGTAGAKVTFEVPVSAPDSLRYYCTVHGNIMGNTITVVNSLNIEIAVEVFPTGFSLPLNLATVDAVSVAEVTGFDLTMQDNSVEVEVNTPVDITGFSLTATLGDQENAQVWTPVNKGTDAVWTNIDTAA